MAEATDDVRLAARALREAWPITPAVRAKLIETLLGIATSTDPKVRVREKMSAIRTLMTTSRLNVEGIRVAAAAVEHDALLARLDEIERQLGDGERTSAAD
jgi:hypothetical protein